MDTSKSYYESVMRDFQTYGRGRTLEHYCRDEGADYKWIEKAKELYGVPSKCKPARAGKKAGTKSTDMIQLHFEPEPPETQCADNVASATAIQEPATEEPSSKPGWSVAILKVMSPEGHEIEVRTSNPSAVSELLAKLTA